METNFKITSFSEENLVTRTPLLRQFNLLVQSLDFVIERQKYLSLAPLVLLQNHLGRRSFARLLIYHGINQVLQFLRIIWLDFQVEVVPSQLVPALTVSWQLVLLPHHYFVEGDPQGVDV